MLQLTLLKQVPGSFAKLRFTTLRGSNEKMGSSVIVIRINNSLIQLCYNITSKPDKKQHTQKL